MQRGSRHPMPTRRDPSPGAGRSPARGSLLLLDGALGGRERLEAPVRDRVAALHGEPVRAVDKPCLGALEGRDLVPEVPGAARVELLLVEGLRAPLSKLVLVAGLVAPELGDRLLDPVALAREQPAGVFRLHASSLMARATRRSLGARSIRPRRTGAPQCGELGVQRKVAILVGPAAMCPRASASAMPCAPMSATRRSKASALTRGSSLTAASRLSSTPPGASAAWMARYGSVFCSRSWTWCSASEATTASSGQLVQEAPFPKVHAVAEAGQP